MFIINLSTCNIYVVFFLQLFKVAIGFAVFTLLLCFALGKAHQVYYLHVPENSQMLPTPVSPWGEPISLSRLSKEDAHCFLHVSISFFSKSKLIAISLTFSSKSFLARGGIWGATFGLILYTNCHHYLFLCLYPSQCGDFPANSVVHHYI